MENRSTICLNMIVKNEAPIIERCLASAKPLIDHWVIVDTGSEDGTQDIIRSFMSDIPGTLHERQWKNFGHNRTEALNLAKHQADYTLTIDADEYLSNEEGFSWGEMGADAYLIEKKRRNRVYRVMHILKSSVDWRWEGALHETPMCENMNSRTFRKIDGVAIESPLEGGARAADPLTYKKDALLLEQALLEEPDNSRYMFYLGNSYRDANEPDLAIRAYKKRIEMGGWKEEVYMSMIGIARLYAREKEGTAKCIKAFLAAHAHTPHRAEALFELGIVFAFDKDWPNAWLFLERAAGMKRNPNDLLFIEEDMYSWRAKLEAAVAGYWIGKHDAAIAFNRELLDGDKLPERLRERVERNLNLSLAALGKSSEQKRA